MISIYLLPDYLPPTVFRVDPKYCKRQKINLCKWNVSILIW